MPSLFPGDARSLCPVCLCGTRVTSRSQEPALSEVEWEPLRLPCAVEGNPSPLFAMHAV